MQVYRTRDAAGRPLAGYGAACQAAIDAVTAYVREKAYHDRIGAGALVPVANRPQGGAARNRGGR